MTETQVQEMAQEIDTKRQELSDFFETKKGGDGRYTMDQADCEKVRSMNAALTDLGKKYDTARDLLQTKRHNDAELERLRTPEHPSGHSNGRQPKGTDGAALSYKSLGEQVLETKAAKEAFAHAGESGVMKPFVVELPNLDVKMQRLAALGLLETKTLMAETGAGFAPPNYRTSIVILSAQARPVVADLIPQDPTGDQIIKYMEETTFTNNAAMTAEGGAAGEGALAFTERSSTVEWLPTILPVTEQQLADVPQLNGLINNRLLLMIYLKEEVQLLSGDGNSPNLKGFSTVVTQTQAVGGDPIPDAIMKAITKVRYTGFANPSGIVMNPNNWQTVRLLKTTTGAYIWGSPSEAGPERIWALPVVQTPQQTLNTALLGDFAMFSHISRRKGVRVEVGFINDDFQRGRKTLRADERLSLEIYRPNAFCTVTGLS